MPAVVRSRGYDFDMATIRSLRGLDDWGVVLSFLPAGWREMAFRLHAWTRARQVKNAETLLRILMVHLAEGCSLQETAVRATQKGWAEVSPVAVFKRLRASEEWLRWMAAGLWRRRERPVGLTGYRVRAVDATTVQEPGSTGTDWRVHFALDVSSLQCDFFSLTDVHGGETFRRLPVRKNDLIMGDRAYGTPPGVAHVLSREGSVLVRINLNMLPLFDPTSARVNILRHLQRLKIGQVGDWPANVHAEGTVFAGRLIGIKRGKHATQRAIKRAENVATRKGTTISAATRAAAPYVFVWTNLPVKELTARRALDLYRLRWQIELAFKRMKSLLGLGALPKTSDSSSRAWIHGKMLVALLIEQFIEAADSFFPWGYHLPPQSLARNAVRAPRIVLGRFAAHRT